MINLSYLATRLKQNTARSLKIKLYVFSFFDEFILIYPFYAIMFQDRGLNSAQISSLLITLSVVIFLLQVPAGSVADKYSRKKILIWAILMRGLAFACWIAFPNYIGFFVGFVLWGIKRAFVSGTLEALVYDELRRLEALKHYTKVTGTMQSYALLGFILGGLSASALAYTGYTVILLLSIAAVCLSAAVIATLPNAAHVKRTDEANYYDYLRDGIKVALARPVLLLIICFGAAIGGLKVVDEYYSLFFNQLHFTNTTIALWTAIISLFGIVGSSLAHRFEHKKIQFGWLLLVWGGLLGIATIVSGLWVPIVIGLFMTLFFFMSVIANTSLQHTTDDTVRATTTSLMGFLTELFALVVYGVFAALGSGDYAFGLRIVAGIILAVGVGFFGITMFIAKKS